VRAGPRSGECGLPQQDGWQGRSFDGAFHQGRFVSPARIRFTMAGRREMKRINLPARQCLRHGGTIRFIRFTQRAFVSRWRPVK
jgi:hypothetical protein